MMNKLKYFSSAIILLILFLIVITETYAQSQFQWVIGGTGNDYAQSIIRTTDGGYALAGDASSFGVVIDMYIVKLDSSGSLPEYMKLNSTGVICHPVFIFISLQQGVL